MTARTPDRHLLGTVLSVCATLALAGILVAAATDNDAISTIAGLFVGASCVAGLLALVLLVRSYVGAGRTAATPTVGQPSTDRPSNDQSNSDRGTLDALEPLRAARLDDPR